MRFVHPQLLWLLTALPLLALAAWGARARRRRALQRFAAGEAWVARFTAGVSPNRRAVKALLLSLGLAAAVVAAARPQWGTRLEPVERRGIDLVVLVDTSLSMAAEDLGPSRLEHARRLIDRLIRNLEGNRVALIRFAGQATLLCPLTLDHAAVRLFLEPLEVESTQVPGTALADALQLAIRTFGAGPESGDDRGRALLLFTDGEDHEGGVDEWIGRLNDAGVAVFPVGCGTARGAPIPLRSKGGTSAGYKKDREGKVVTTRLVEETLERLALETGGRYHRATAEGQEVARIGEALGGLDARAFGSVLRARYEERFQLPLALALLALLGESLLGDRRRTARAEGE